MKRSVRQRKRATEKIEGKELERGGRKREMEREGEREIKRERVREKERDQNPFSHRILQSKALLENAVNFLYEAP